MGVPVETHIYSWGVHGLGGHPLVQDPKLQHRDVSQWTVRCAAWLHATLGRRSARQGQ